jgi:hypothetical protein
MTYVFDEFVWRHSGHDEQVPDDDSKVLRPAGHHGGPQLFHLLRVLVAELQKKKNLF